MPMTCFPDSFPTGYAPSTRGSSRSWPRCTNAEPGSYGHECGDAAGFIGLRSDGSQAYFCSACKERGSEARRYSDWQALPTTGLGEHRAEVTTARAFIVTLPGDAGSDWTVRTWASTAEQAARQVCDWQGIPTLFVRAVRPDTCSGLPPLKGAQVQLIARSSGVLPASRAATNHSGFRPRPDQVRLGFSG